MSGISGCGVANPTAPAIGMHYQVFKPPSYFNADAHYPHWSFHIEEGPFRKVILFARGDEAVWSYHDVAACAYLSVYSTQA
jgi:hypothetical protein